jgi:hypothetical protein
MLSSGDVNSARPPSAVARRRARSKRAVSGEPGADDEVRFQPGVWTDDVELPAVQRRVCGRLVADVEVVLRERRPQLASTRRR